MTVRSDTYPGALDQPGTSHRWRVRLNGERYTYLLPRDGDDELPTHLEEREDEEDIQHPTKADAADFARREYKRLKERVGRGRTDRPETLSELLDDFEDRELPKLAESSQVTYRNALKPVRVFFVDGRGDPRARDITRGDISSYLDWRRVHDPRGNKRDEPLSKWTLQKERAVLHKVFEKAVNPWEYVPSNPVSGTDRPKPDQRTPEILSDDQLDRLIKECYETGPMLGLYAVVLAETGMRCESEALWLQWGDVDLEGGFLKVVSGRDGHRTKSGEGRDIPITERLEEALREHAARFRLKTYDGKRSLWIFHHQFANRGRDAGDRVESMRRGLTSAAERAKLPERWRPHDLRHRRVTTWLADGKSVAKVKGAMGHSDLETTMGYYKHAKEHLRSLVEEPDEDEVADKLDRVMGMLKQMLGDAAEQELTGRSG